MDFLARSIRSAREQASVSGKATTAGALAAVSVIALPLVPPGPTEKADGVAISSHLSCPLIFSTAAFPVGTIASRPARLRAAAIFSPLRREFGRRSRELPLATLGTLPIIPQAQPEVLTCAKERWGIVP